MLQQASPDISPLIYFINQLHPQEKSVENYLKEHVALHSYKKGDLLLQVGEACPYVYFILEGVIRGFIHDQGKEVTTWISCEHEMVTSISGIVFHTTALENIEVIEDCRALRIEIKVLEDLYEIHPEFNINGRKLFQYYYADAERRALIARLVSAEEKYHYFIKHYGHLANRVPLKYIASFLGMTHETLSRIRNKFSRGL